MKEINNKNLILTRIKKIQLAFYGDYTVLY